MSCDFNPRIPYGMRRLRAGSGRTFGHFNPRIPYGMRPEWEMRIRGRVMISIHASRMGCDNTHGAWARQSRHFNPRIPYGMRLREWTLHSIIWKFLPALRADYIADIPEHLSVCIFGL